MEAIEGCKESNGVDRSRLKLDESFRDSSDFALDENEKMWLMKVINIASKRKQSKDARSRTKWTEVA
jgi:hypothetical protein